MIILNGSIICGRLFIASANREGGRVSRIRGAAHKRNPSGAFIQLHPAHREAGILNICCPSPTQRSPFYFHPWWVGWSNMSTQRIVLFTVWLMWRCPRTGRCTRWDAMYTRAVVVPAWLPYERSTNKGDSHRKTRMTIIRATKRAFE